MDFIDGSVPVRCRSDFGRRLAGRAVRSALPAAVQPAHKTASQGSGLEMRVEVEGGNLRVRWNLDLPATQVVEGAILQIDEGPQHRRLHLDSAQLADGSLLYKPVSGDVMFHLEIRGRGAAPLSQTVRVIDGLKPRADLGSTEKAPLRPQRTAKRTESGSRRPFKRKLVFESRPAGLGPLRETSRNVQKEIAAKPPDIQLASEQNAASLPFAPANAPPEYSKPARRTKFLTVIKHLVLPSTKLREGFQP